MPIFRIFLLLLCFAEQVFCAPAGMESEDEIVPIAHKGVDQVSVGVNGLRAIFRMRLRNWQNHAPITVFILPDEDPLHGRFCKEILNVFPAQMRRAWNRLVFSGSGQAPITVKSVEEMRESVKSTPGAIGYLHKKEITNDVKILQIE